MRIMGLDIGTKRIGIALSDESGTIAQAKEVILRKSDKKAVSKIIEMVREFKVKEIVVGLPIHMDGTEGARAKDSIKFAEELKKNTAVHVDMWDERLSTREAEGVLLEASMSRAKRKKVIDKVAAQIILQGYLDSR
ncbi:MAG: Holliday junction resolvase RuvX [Candidatus Omnitrophota bacterium]